MSNEAEEKPNIDYLNDDVFKALQNKARQAFEEGWRAAGGDSVRSPYKEPPRGWRKAWMQCETRKWLVENGVISGKDTWK